MDDHCSSKTFQALKTAALALTLGLVLAAVRRTSGGILAPLLAHVTWSAMMLFLLDPLFH